MHPLDFFKGEDKRVIADRIKAVFATGESTAEAKFASKNGTRTPYYYTGTTLQTMLDPDRALVIHPQEQERAVAAWNQAVFFSGL